MNTPKIDVKLFAEPGSSIESEELIPIFHRFIQRGELDDLLIDVADYSHVPEGPGVLLIGHDAQYALDEAEGRLGLLYSRRRETHPSLAGLSSIEERLRSALRSALVAARKLEAQPELSGRLAFRGDELLLRINDRLAAPNDDATELALRPPVEALGQQLYPGTEVDVVWTNTPRTLFGLTVLAKESPALEHLLDRLQEEGSSDIETPRVAAGGGAGA